MRHNVGTWGGLGVLPPKNLEIWWSESDSGGFMTVAAVPTCFNK